MCACIHILKLNQNLIENLCICFIKHGFTSLHCAAQQGHVLIVKLLLEHGASPDITNNVRDTVFAQTKKYVKSRINHIIKFFYD